MLGQPKNIRNKIHVHVCNTYTYTYIYTYTWGRIGSRNPFVGAHILVSKRLNRLPRSPDKGNRYRTNQPTVRV